MPMIRIPLVGAYFRPPANSILKAAPSGVKLHLIPEPSNPHDPNAIQVKIFIKDIPEGQLKVLEEGLQSQGYPVEDFWSAVDKDPFWHVGYFKREFAAEAKKANWNLKDGTLTFAADGKPQILLQLNGGG